MNKYTIREVAALFGISTDAIRLYEREGLVTPLRNPSNGYRYYETPQIQKIMAIYLYRQLNVGLSDIKQFFQMPTFTDISNGFTELIARNEAEIARLQSITSKLQFMKDHLNHLNEGISTFQLVELPKCYVISRSTELIKDFAELKDLFHSPAFSFGNFSFKHTRDNQEHYKLSSIDFVIREDMMKLCPFADKADTFPSSEKCQCLYTVVCAAPENDIPFDITPLLQESSKKGYTLSDRLYAFYTYSLPNGDNFSDYYEIYIPLTND